MDIRLCNIILCLVKKHFPASNTGRKRVEPEFVLDELLRIRSSIESLTDVVTS